MMWVIIDGNNWFSIAWYALKPTKSLHPDDIQADLEDRSARSVQTVLNWVEDIKRQLKPETFAICWDSPNSLRRQMFQEYKGGRGEKPEGYYVAMDDLRRKLELAGEWNVEIDGLEADDLLAKFAIDAVKEGSQCLLCSSDKDLHQCLIAGKVSQCTSVGRPEDRQRVLIFQILTAKLFEERYGVTLSQWIDYRCMAGDKTDGLPKPYGVGDKIALKILNACGSLDEFYADPLKAPITEGKRKAMLEFKPQLQLVRSLITLPLRKSQ